MSNATVMTLNLQITGSAIAPLTEAQVDTRAAVYREIPVVHSVDVAMDLDHNRAKFLLVFDWPVTLAELVRLGL